MKNQVKIEKTNDLIKINSPFLAFNVETFRSKGGKWNATDRSWDFPATENTQKMILDLFGDPDSGLVNAKIKYSDLSTSGAEWFISGYKLCCRRHRDYSVEMPEGVALLEGKFKSSGGSAKNPRVEGGKDLVFSCVMFRSLAEKLNLENLSSETVNPLEKFSDEALLEEIKRRGL